MSTEARAKRSKKHRSPLVDASKSGGGSNLVIQQTGRSKRRRSEENERKSQEEDLEEEEALTSLIFGGNRTWSGKLVKHHEKLLARDQVEHNPDGPVQGDAPLFQLDFGGDGASSANQAASVKDDDDDETTSYEEAYENDYADDDDEAAHQDKDGGSVWRDDDDVKMNIMKRPTRLRKLRGSRTEQVSTMDRANMEKRLRKRFQATSTASTEWANPKSTSSSPDEEYEAFGNSSITLLAKSISSLPPQILQVSRCKNANLLDPNASAIQAVQFHPASDPDSPLMLTAGFDKTLRFFKITSSSVEDESVQAREADSEKLHGIFFPSLPIYSASFLGSTHNVVVSGRRSFFYIYDMVAGKLEKVPRIIGRNERSLERCTASPDGKTIAFLGCDGNIILIDVASRQWKYNLKLNGSVRAVCYTSQHEMLASGSDGDVYRFDTRYYGGGRASSCGSGGRSRCVERFSNQDGTITSSISASSQCWAVGAESGVVNLYSPRGVDSEPRHAISRHGSREQKIPIEQVSREPLKSVMNLQTSCDATLFNHDGQILAMSSRRASNSQGLKLMHVPTRTIFSNWPTSNTPLSYTWSMDFSPQSKYFVVGNDKGNALLYRLLHYHHV